MCEPLLDTLRNAEDVLCLTLYPAYSSQPLYKLSPFCDSLVSGCNPNLFLHIGNLPLTKTVKRREKKEKRGEIKTLKRKH
ncbi:hypothetical protein GDO81_006686 [Engystomops pustulosus]|uniref:Uncharacterized protein n=1 Tax=Engystomops pustulosus TaxID=76066 RepID=A0AAV7D1U0_ENGPU|nr:hypothetical protein GDO81_006686 [Engystomops pustulosus]